MKIEVKLRASLKRFSDSPDGVFQMELKDGASVSEVVGSLKIPDNDLGLISVNKKLTDASAVLKDGDKVELFTMMKGG